MDTVLLTVGLAAAAYWARRAPDVVRDFVILLLLVIPMNALRLCQLDTARLRLEYWRHQSLSPAFKGVAVWLALGLLVALVRFHRVLVRAAFRGLTWIFPLALILAGEASALTVWRIIRPPAEEARQAPIPAAAAVRPQRVVWMIFDEMDYRLAFEPRGRARLPEFERLESESLHASRAYPPGGRTMISVPALLAGRLVTGSQAMDGSELWVRYEGDAKAVPWRAQETIFNLEREKGWRTAAAGWYFPYARVFGRDIEAWQYQGWRLALNPDRPFAGLMADELRVLGEGKSRSLVGRSLSAEEHKRIVGAVVAEAERQASDAALDLVFVHLPVPHAPFYYDARTGGDAWPPRPVMGYFDHLELGDHVLGEIRRAMSRAGVAKRTVLVVSSDHWNRQSDLIDGRMDHRVPFLVYFPEARQRVEYEAPFNTVLTRRLVTAILDGEVRGPEDAARWIDRERGELSESPYNGN